MSLVARNASLTLYLHVQQASWYLDVPPILDGGQILGHES